MLKITGVNKFVEKTEKQKERIKQGAANYVRNATKAVLRDLVLNTPQWSGETAASWRIQLRFKELDYSQPSNALDDWKDALPNPKFIGDKAALKIAYEHAVPTLKAIRYNSIVSIVNVAPYSETLAVTSEDELKLRKGNFIPGDVMATKYVAAKYRLSSNLTGLQLKDVLNYD